MQPPADARSPFVVRFLPTLLAIVIGLLVAFGLPARAQEGGEPTIGPDPCANIASPPSVVDVVLGGVDPVVKLIAQGGIAAALVLAALVWLRAGFPARFDPPGGATEHSRWWNMTAAMLIGLLLGLATIAPAIPLPGPTPVGWRLLILQLLGGFLVATSAAFGRDWYTRSKGVAAERRITREQAKAAGLTTGQMRVLDIPEPTPGPNDPPGGPTA